MVVIDSFCWGHLAEALMAIGSVNPQGLIQSFLQEIRSS